jgi:hypothetical protein
MGLVGGFLKSSHNAKSITFWSPKRNAGGVIQQSQRIEPITFLNQSLQQLFTSGLRDGHKKSASGFRFG